MSALMAVLPRHVIVGVEEHCLLQKQSLAEKSNSYHDLRKKNISLRIIVDFKTQN